MPEHVHTLCESGWKWCSFLSGLFSSLISRRCPIGVGSSLERSHPSANMAAIEPIDISSSDSEWDLDEYRSLYDSPSALLDTAVLSPQDAVPGTSSQVEASPPRGSAGSSSWRNLPAWASQHPTNAIAHGGVSRNVPSAKPNGSSSNFSRYRQDVGKSLNQQSSRDARPTSHQRAMPSGQSSNLVEDVGTSHFRDIHDRSHNSAWPNDKNHMKNHMSNAHDDEVVMYENSGNRILPPSLMQKRYVSNNQYVDPSDPFFHPGVGEEQTVGNDERLVYQAALQDLNQPKIEATLPEGLLSVSLLRHQKIALAWMLQKETRSLHCLGGILADDQGLGKTVSMIALIQMQRSLQSNSKLEDFCNHKTEALNLDDEEDDSSAALHKAKQTQDSDDIKLIPEINISTQKFHRKRPAAGTLVVCPATVLRQWARELDEKVADEAKLSVLIYHGSNRPKDPAELAKYDVVLTTFSIVTNEVPKQPLVDEDEDEQKNMEKYGLSSGFSTNQKRKQPYGINKKGKKGKKGIDSSSFNGDCGTLSRVAWFRVILDEAQTIKNHRTQVARACCGLRAKRRWCLSGTPIQNSIDELFSYFRFLRYDPYATYKSFCHTIKIPISRNSIHGYKKLQAVLRAIMLRRTKDTSIGGEPIINLPPKTIHLKKVDFSPEERAFYNRLEADSRSQFKAYAAAGTVRQNYANILLMLLRLRQACDHPLLAKGSNMDSVKGVSTEMAKSLPKDILINLLNHLETSLPICCVCSDAPEDAVVTVCRHVFCYMCISDYLTGDDNTCPASGCKEQLSSDVIFCSASLRSCISNDLDSDSKVSLGFPEKEIVLQNEYSSSKIRATLEILQSECKLKNSSTEVHDLVKCNGNTSSSEKAFSGLETDRPAKAIIFSQWTRMLDLVESSLMHSGLRYRRLDGSMSLASRDKAIKEFNTDPKVTVMLMSLKAGNLGLNMVAACHVILLDLWWNPTAEDQAVDRAHRIGQTRPVTVSRLTIKNTVEDRILALQEEKRKMVASAFGEDQSGGSGTRLTVEDLKYLFMV